MSNPPPTLLELYLERGARMREIKRVAIELKAYAHNVESEEMVNKILGLCITS